VGAMPLFAIVGAMLSGSTCIKNKDSISNGREAEAEGHARGDEGSGAGVDMVAQHSGASLTATRYLEVVSSRSTLQVLMQHDMQQG